MKVWERKERRRDKKESEKTSLASHGLAAAKRNVVAPTYHSEQLDPNMKYCKKLRKSKKLWEMAFQEK